MHTKMKEIPEGKDIPIDSTESSGKEGDRESKEATRLRPNPMPVSIVISEQESQNQKDNSEE